MTKLYISTSKLHSTWKNIFGISFNNNCENKIQIVTLTLSFLLRMYPCWIVRVRGVEATLSCVFGLKIILLYLHLIYTHWFACIINTFFNYLFISHTSSQKKCYSKNISNNLPSKHKKKKQPCYQRVLSAWLAAVAFDR